MRHLFSLCSTVEEHLGPHADPSPSAPSSLPKLSNFLLLVQLRPKSFRGTVPGYVEEAWLATRIYAGGLGKLPDTWRRLGELSGTVPGHMEEAWIATRTYGGGLISCQGTWRRLG